MEAAFLRREGLVEHLRAALNADEVSDVDVDAARRLLNAVSSPENMGGGDVSGKVWAAAPALAAEIGADAAPAVAAQLARAIDETPAVVNWMNHEAEGRLGQRHAVRTQ